MLQRFQPRWIDILLASVGGVYVLPKLALFARIDGRNAHGNGCFVKRQRVVLEDQSHVGICRQDAFDLLVGLRTERTL